MKQLDDYQIEFLQECFERLEAMAPHYSFDDWCEFTSWLDEKHVSVESVCLTIKQIAYGK